MSRKKGSGGVDSLYYHHERYIILSILGVKLSGGHPTKETGFSAIDDHLDLGVLNAPSCAAHHVFVVV